MLVTVVLVFQEHLLISEIRGKGHRRDSEPGEAALKPIPPREETCVSPRLAISFVAVRHHVSKCPPGVGVCYQTNRGQKTNARSQGSYRGCPAAWANLRGSKPVMLGFWP